MMIEEMRDEDENDMENTSSNEKSRVRLASIGLEDLVSVLWPDGSGLVPPLSEMVNWPAHKIL